MNDELLEAYKSELGAILKRMATTEPDGDNYGDLLEQANSIADRIIEIDKMKISKSMKEMEQDGNLAKCENDLEIEKEKQKISNKKMILELTRTCAPVAIECLTFLFGFDRMQRFEATDIYTKLSSKLLQGRLPRIWK